MTALAFKIFLTCLVIFTCTAIIEDALKPTGRYLHWLKVIGGYVVLIGFVSFVIGIFMFIWGL